jgi:AcrR family transcriptional regulator
MRHRSVRRAKPALPASGVVPVQTRSQETVRAILEAAVEVIRTCGFDEATTEAIGHRAGVGPATLFRYFPDKASLLARVAEHAWEVEARAFAEAAVMTGESTAAELVGRLVRRAIQSAERLAPINRAFEEHIGPLRMSRAYEPVLERVYRVVFERLFASDEVTAFVLVKGLDSVFGAAARARPDWIANGRLERAAAALVLGVLAAANEETNREIDGSHLAFGP